MDDHTVTILLTTCDTYADAWEPFFRLWHINWPDCSYPFVINAETKSYTSDIFRISTVYGGKGIPWSKRLKKCLRNIKSEYVLLCLEDYFLQAPVDTTIFNAAIKTMNERPDVGVIQFAIDIHAKYDENELINQYFSPVPKYKKDRQNGRIYCVLSLYRTRYLYKLLLKSESPWEFEIFGSIRSQFFSDIVLRENENHSRCFTYFIEPKYGYAISRGMWLPKNRELFARYGIDVDFSKLGIMNETEYQELLERYYGKRKKTPREHHTMAQIIAMPFTDPKQFFMILCNWLKKKLGDIRMNVKLSFPFFP